MLDWLASGIETIAGWLGDHLPRSPFLDFMEELPQGFRDALGALNWLVPFRDMLALMSAWLAAILLWRAVRFVIKHVIGHIVGKDK